MNHCPAHAPLADEADLHRDLLTKAKCEALKSPHPNVKVGALLMSVTGAIIGACNDFPKGLEHTPERMNCGDLSQWIRCAEHLVISRAASKGVLTEGASLYVTLDPCTTCADLIIEAGIEHIYLPDEPDCPLLKAKWYALMEIGAMKLAEAGVQMTRIPMD